jgi:hypothetical protein
MTIRRRHWTFPERVFLSLYGGFALPFLYLFAALLVAGILGSLIADRGKEWLFFPLIWPAWIIESLYHPRIAAVGDVFDAAVFEFIATFFINFFLYGVSVFGLLSIINLTNRPRSSS